MTVPIERQGCGDHIWGDTTVVSAVFVVAPTGEADGRPAVYKAGTMVMTHSCTKEGCGVTNTWKV